MKSETKHNDTQHNDIQHNDTQHNDWVSLMMSVANAECRIEGFNDE
jgi:hypothetical protein